MCLMISKIVEYLTAKPPTLKTAHVVWVPVILGLLVLYVPTFYDLLSDLWSTEEQAHGPIIFALAIWLIYRQLPVILKKEDCEHVTFSGWLIFILALMFYFIGRTQQIILFELGSIIFILAAITLIKRGSSSLKLMWFPLFFMLFMLPLPGTLVATLTLPMKMAVSYATENILFWSGYPIARNGVMLQIGQYQLLVADACAGLQTLLTLEALGLYYLNIVRNPSIFRNTVLAILIIPISLAANIIRVTALTLITYYLGDAAGQGFLHEFAGIVLFLSALLLILSVDAVLQFIVKVRADKTELPAG
jgi:exosortase B